MAKAAPKLSGLLKMGAVVPSDSPLAQPDGPVEVVRAHHGLPAPAATKPAPALMPEAAAPAVGRTLLDIPVRLIDPNPLAPREVYTPDMIKERANALRTQGQHDPIHVIPNPDVPGRYIICDGWTRVLACVEHDVFPALLAEVHTDLSLIESSWFGYTQNEERKQHFDLDRARYYAKLRASGVSDVEIARRTNKSKAVISKYQAYTRLPEVVLDIIRETPDQFPYNVAYALQKLHDACGIPKTVSLATRFQKDSKTREWLREQVELAINPANRKPTASSKTLKYTNGFYKERGNTFEVTITVTDSEQRKQFAAALESLVVTVGQTATATDAPDHPGDSNDADA